MWIVYAIGSSFFAGITAILAKCGIRRTDSDVATAIRTIVVLLFSWLMVLSTGTIWGIVNIDGKTVLFLVLSGLATGASWMCYFRALQKGDINKVVPIDKSSTVLTILLALIFLHEGVTAGKLFSVVLIGLGTMLMITRKDSQRADTGQTETHWLLYAAIDKKELFFIILSGLATGASWMCYYKALQEGPASVVVPIDKLSILVTIAFSRIVFHEKLTKKAAAGLLCMTVGTLLLAML